ncbi:C2 family cysteine protease [Roseixanthobacter pseudopolyaromaticivorans]|uniref:C2 family cysteine protease n=1 Tax=Xanthobacteraceae TaxID=335928 RepID=UPI003728027F
MPHDVNGDLNGFDTKTLTTVRDSEFLLQRGDSFSKISTFLYKTDLFPHPPQISDAAQGRLGNCFLLSALNSIIQIDPTLISGMMKDLRGGSVVVRLYDDNGAPVFYKFEKTYVTFSSGFLKRSGLQHHNAYWVYMIEKAFAWARISKAKRNGKTLEYREALDGGEAKESFRILLGDKSASVLRIYSSTVNDDIDSPYYTLKEVLRIPLSQYESKNPVTRANANFYLDRIFGTNNIKDCTNFLKYIANSTIHDDFVTHFKNANFLRRDDVIEFVNNRFPNLDKSAALALTTYVQKNFSGKRGTGLYSCQDELLFTQIQAALQKKAFITASTNIKIGREDPNSSTTRGLAENHEYQVFGACIDDTTQLRFVMLRNPWIKDVRTYDAKVKTVTNASGNQQNVTVLSARQVREISNVDAYCNKVGKLEHGAFLLEITDLAKRFQKITISNGPVKAPTA